jgi:hypothetical protein
METPCAMPQTIILHVGAYKTATSAIQSLFTLHDQEIASRFGVLYPKAFRRLNSGVLISDAPRTDSYGHHMLAHMLRNERSHATRPEDVDAALAELREEIVRAERPQAFVTTELLSFCPRRFKKRILDALPGFEWRVIYTVRNPVDFVESMNNQLAKSGQEIPPAEGEVGFLHNIADWIELVGEERVRVPVFSSEAFRGFLDDFFAVFQDPALAAYARENLPRTNTSVSAEAAEIRLAFDRHLPAPANMSVRVRHMVTRALAELDERLERRTRLVTLDPEARRGVAERNKAQINEICRRFVEPSLWPLLLGSGDEGEPSPPGPMSFSAADLGAVVDCFAEVLGFASKAGEARGRRRR